MPRGYLLRSVRLEAVYHKWLPLLLVVVSLSSQAEGDPTQPLDGMNAYVIRAVKVLAEGYSGRGYDLSAYTHDLKYGTATIPAGRKAPSTMCVAAVAEVIIVALNLYMEETHDYSPQMYLPVEGWSRLRPRDFRSHIWVDHHLQSYGTADAMSTFGVGRHLPFNNLQAGSFINLNRSHGGGHAVVFLAYIDKKGTELPAYSSQVAGFKYFSSQGRIGAPGSGFGFKYGFFNVNGKPYCPALPDGKRVDCGIIYSFSQKYLNTGYMLVPSKWEAPYRDQSLQQLAERLYQQNYNRLVGEEGLPGIDKTLSHDAFLALLQEKDTMTLSPAYRTEVMPDDPK